MRHSIKSTRFTGKEITLVLITGVAIIGAFLLPKVPQDPAYHQFADTRTILSVPNFWNVLSNLPFVFVGLTGLVMCVRSSLAIVPELKPAYILFFIGVAAVAFGSGYYHLWPSNQTLVWDRLPMTIGFMSIFALIIAEFISVKAGRVLFLPLVIAGFASVFYWDYSESLNAGDLRFYGLVQFLPMLLIPLILLMYQSRFTHIGLYWAVLAAYGLAKLAELGDHVIYDLLDFSGHSLKHLIAAAAPWMFYLALKKRSSLTSSEVTP